MSNQAFNPLQGMTWAQITQHANQAFAQQYTQLNTNVHYGQLAQQIQQQALPLHDWVFDGEPCTIIEFAEKCFGDTAERDVFLLKYTRIGELE